MTAPTQDRTETWVCAGCGAAIEVSADAFLYTVSVTPDAVFVEEAVISFAHLIVELDVALKNRGFRVRTAKDDTYLYVCLADEVTA